MLDGVNWKSTMVHVANLQGWDKVRVTLMATLIVAIHFSITYIRMGEGFFPTSYLLVYEAYNWCILLLH